MVTEMILSPCSDFNYRVMSVFNEDLIHPALVLVLVSSEQRFLQIL